MKPITTTQGFTLIEILTVVGMLLILASLTAPNLADLLNEGRYRQLQNQLHQAYFYARSEAIKREQPVIVEFMNEELIVRSSDGKLEHRRYQLSLHGFSLGISNHIEIMPTGGATAATWQLNGPNNLKSCLQVLISGQSEFKEHSCGQS